MGKEPPDPRNPIQPLAEGSPQTDSDPFLWSGNRVAKSEPCRFLWRDRDGEQPRALATATQGGTREGHCGKAAGLLPAAAPPGSPLCSGSQVRESRVCCKVGARLSTRGQVVARGSAGAWSATGRWSVADTPADCCATFTPPGPPAGRGEDGDRGEKASTVSGSGQGHPTLQLLCPASTLVASGGGPRPRTHKAAASLDARAVGAGPELPTLPAGISSPGSGQGGSSGAARKGELWDTQGSHWACREPLWLSHLLTHRERGVLVRFTSGPALHASAGLGQVLWEGVVTSFQVLRVSWAQP